MEGIRLKEDLPFLWGVLLVISGVMHDASNAIGGISNSSAAIEFVSGMCMGIAAGVKLIAIVMFVYIICKRERSEENGKEII